MNVAQAFRVLVRHWLLLVLGLALTAGVSVLGYRATPAQYQVHESVLFLPPALPATATVPGTNPFLTFGTSINITSRVFAQLLTSQDVTSQLSSGGASAQYTVTPSVDGTPVLQISASDRSQLVATRTLRGLDAYITQELAARQSASGAPASTWIRASVVTDPQPPSRSRSGALRAAAALGLAGLLLALALPFAVEALVGTWQRRRLQLGLDAFTEPTADDASAPRPLTGDTAAHPNPGVRR